MTTRELAKDALNKILDFIDEDHLLRPIEEAIEAGKAEARKEAIEAEREACAALLDAAELKQHAELIRARSGLKNGV